MRMAVIKNNIVTNVIEADEGFEIAGMVLVPSDTGDIGWIWDGEKLIAPIIESPVPSSVTRRQIITGLALAEWITKQEAIDALSTGARPAAVEAVIATLPEEDQFDALTKWIGFTEAYRTDPLVLALASAEGKSEAEIDDFFRMCAGIE